MFDSCHWFQLLDSLQIRVSSTMFNTFLSTFYLFEYSSKPLLVFIIWLYVGLLLNTWWILRTFLSALVCEKKGTNLFISLSLLLIFISSWQGGRFVPLFCLFVSLSCVPPKYFVVCLFMFCFCFVFFVFVPPVVVTSGSTLMTAGTWMIEMPTDSYRLTQPSSRMASQGWYKT